MNIGKTLAVSAVSGILMGVLAGCGDTKPAQADPKVPTADTTAPAAKDCCKGKNESRASQAAKPVTTRPAPARTSARARERPPVRVPARSRDSTSTRQTTPQSCGGGLAFAF